MDAVRTPYWLTAADRAALTAAITTRLADATDLHPVLDCHLRDVLTELSVAAARDRVWPDKSELVRKATGYPADALPIRMSDEEIAAVLETADLTTSVRRTLTGATGE